MKEKLKYVVVAVVILAVCSVGAYANVFWYNTSPCRAIDISLTDTRVINFLDSTDMATVDVYNDKNYQGYNTWLVCWHTVTTAQGRHDKKTPLFNIKGDECRINWETVGHENDSSIHVTVYKDFGLFDYEWVDVFRGNNFPFSDTRYEYDGAGTYYLYIIADELEFWSAEIEDYY